MTDRWIKTYEKLLKWEWYGDPLMVATLIHLLIKANWKDKKWRGVNVKRGQLITSRTRLADEIGLTERQLRTCLERMQETGEIACETTNRYTIITICNYDIYQDKAEAERPAESPAESPTNDQQTTNKQPTSGQQTTTPIEYIERKEYLKTSRKKESVSDAPAREDFLETFGLLNNVKMAAEQYRHLVETYGQEATDTTIDDLSCKLADGTVNSSNHYATILSWLRYQRRNGKKPAMSSASTTQGKDPVEYAKHIWSIMNEQERQQHLEEHGGLYPWEDEEILKTLRQ